MKMLIKDEPFSPQEKRVIVEELEDVRDHYDSLIEGNAFETDIEKEEIINRVETLDNILKKV
jgi:hypothetical protein